MSSGYTERQCNVNPLWYLSRNEILSLEDLSMSSTWAEAQVMHVTCIMPSPIEMEGPRVLIHADMYLPHRTATLQTQKRGNWTSATICIGQERLSKHASVRSFSPRPSKCAIASLRQSGHRDPCHAPTRFEPGRTSMPTRHDNIIKPRKNNLNSTVNKFPIKH